MFSRPFPFDAYPDTLPPVNAPIITTTYTRRKIPRRFSCSGCIAKSRPDAHPLSRLSVVYRPKAIHFPSLAAKIGSYSTQRGFLRRRTGNEHSPETGSVFRSKQPRSAQAEDQCGDQSARGKNQGGWLGFLDLLGAGLFTGIGGVSGSGGIDRPPTGTSPSGDATTVSDCSSARFMEPQKSLREMGHMMGVWKNA
jgi:hypothetical protein